MEKTSYEYDEWDCSHEYPWDCDQCPISREEDKIQNRKYHAREQQLKEKREALGLVFETEQVKTFSDEEELACLLR